jgi:hypothetical protein
MLQLSDKWGPVLVSQPETGLGYQVASIILKDGARYDQALIEAGYVTRIRGLEEIPFREDDIAAIIVTHDGWDFATDK